MLRAKRWERGKNNPSRHDLFPKVLTPSFLHIQTVLKIFIPPTMDTTFLFNANVLMVHTNDLTYIDNNNKNVWSEQKKGNFRKRRIITSFWEGGEEGTDT